MKKFLVTYHAPIDVMTQASNATPEQRQEGMKAWMVWAQKCGDKLVDMGTPLMNGQQLSTGGAGKSSSKNFSGYSIMQGENIDEVKALLKEHPHLNGWNADASIEVNEAMSMGDM